MFNIKNAKRFCSEDISLIENYDKASKDLLEVWDIHHRKEDEGYSKQELKDNGFYYKRPASELIFITHAKHTSLHHKGKTGYWKGKHHSEETRRKMSLNHADFKGEKHPLYGKHHSNETRRKISEANKGKKLSGEKHPRSKPILQIDKQTGQVIKTWPCTREVQRILRINPSNISACCLEKRKQAGGYIWKYA